MNKTTLIVASMAAIVLAAAAGTMYYRSEAAASVPEVKYPVSQIEHDLCGGSKLGTYKDQSSSPPKAKLYCEASSSEPRAENAIIPGSMFTLVQLQPLCPQDGKAIDSKGSLTCVEKKPSGCAPGEFRRLNEYNELKCVKFLERYGIFQ